jgi:hypothetical protein
MKIKYLGLWILLGILCISCNKSSSNAPQLPVTTSSNAAAINDLTKPYLTDDKVQKFLQSMSEGQNPFEYLFAPGTRAATPADLASRMAALDAFARKYGFSGYQDYVTVWGRIAVGQAVIIGESMKQSAREMAQKMIQSAEEQLKNPNLSPDMRKAYEQQVASGKQSLQQMDQPSKTTLNDSDLALVKKYSPQITEASKKFNQRSIPTQ